jgi:hypothetical protein
MIIDSGGTAILTELELVEPSLYLRFHPHHISRVVDAIIQAGNEARRTRIAMTCSARPPVAAPSMHFPD